MTAAMTFASCSGDSASGSSDPLLAKVGNSKLFLSELKANMPGGLTEPDSVKFARAFVRNWIDGQLVSEIAPDAVDMSKIDKMVEEYRNQLILWEYRNMTFDSSADMSIPEDTILAYYEKNKHDFKLASPLVKGVYLKVPDDAKELPKLRKLYKSNKTDDLDKLEKFALNSALHFDYFGDSWIDWEQIEARIPHDFGNNINAWLGSHRSFDESIDGFTYLLDIDSVTPAGSIMPYLTARPLIVDRILASRRKEYDSRLRKKLYDDAMKRGKIEILCDMGL